MNKEKNIVLSLDVSTTTIGICLLLDDGSDYGKIIELTHVSPKVSNKIDKTEALFTKIEIFRNEFLKKYKDLGIKQVILEEPLIKSNNANTVSTLLRFNGMVSLAAFEELGVPVKYISSYDARKYSFPEFIGIRKFGKNGEPYEDKKVINALKKSNFVLFGNYSWDLDKKTLMQSKVAEIFPDIEWIYDKKGELKKENFDASDAYVAALGFLNRERYGELDMKASNIKIQGNTATYDLTYWGKTYENNALYLNNKSN